MDMLTRFTISQTDDRKESNIFLTAKPSFAAAISESRLHPGQNAPCNPTPQMRCLQRKQVQREPRPQDGLDAARLTTKIVYVVKKAVGVGSFCTMHVSVMAAPWGCLEAVPWYGEHKVD